MPARAESTRKRQGPWRSAATFDSAAMAILAMVGSIGSRSLSAVVAVVSECDLLSLQLLATAALCLGPAYSDSMARVAPRARSSRQRRLSKPRRPRHRQYLGEQGCIARRPQARKALRVILAGCAMRRVQ